MSILTALKGVFGSGDNATKIIDAVVNTGDALFFTKEEKSQANLQLLQLKIDWAKATTGSRLARRVLAFMFSGVFLTLIVLAVIMGLIGEREASEFIFQVNRDTLATPVAVILGFYFATQMIRK